MDIPYFKYFRWIMVIFAAPIFYFMRLAVIKFRRVARLSKAIRHIPGPWPHPLFGNILQHGGFHEGGLKWFRWKSKKFPRISRMWWGPFDANISVYHPDTIKQVLRSSMPKSVHGNGGYSFLINWLGDGLLLASGDKWFRNRRLLTPAFHFDVLKPYVNIYNNAADILMNKFEKGSHSGEGVEIFNKVSLCTLDVVLRCAFSYDGDIQEQGMTNPYVKSTIEISKIIFKRFLSAHLAIDFTFYRSPEGKEYSKCVDYVHKISDDVIQKRKQELRTNSAKTNKRYLDFLDTLLSARDENNNGLSDLEIRQEVDTFLFEGHDTTASAISWILYTLSEYPEYQSRCREEVRDILKDRTNRDIQWDDLQYFDFLTLCIKECLRLHSPVPFIARQTSEECIIDGYTLPKDSEIMLELYTLHHNEDVWGEDHMEFVPERFSSENMKSMDPFAFCPFSAGKRNCIGQTFAMHELKVIVAKVLDRFELLLDKSHLVEHVPEVIMRTTNGIKIFFKTAGH